MTKLATNGMFSCCSAAIHGFKPGDRENNKEYINNPGSFSFKEESINTEGTVAHFYRRILFPSSQPMGQTDDYPFEALMQAIENHDYMKDKLLFCILNKQQTLVDDGYWLEQLKKWGFNQIDITRNTIGMDCYVFSRCPLRVGQPKETNDG